MPKDLSEIRKMKGLSLQQLASRAGISVAILAEYEQGKQEILSADLKRLAKVLYVEEWDINRRSSPPPAPRPAPPAQSPQPKKKPAAKAPPKPSPARDSQIAHMLQLATKIGIERSALETEIGKALDQLTQTEARQWNANLMRRHAEMRADDKVERKRAYLPEGVDGFEMGYLQQQQQEATRLHFTLFDGQAFEGVVIGFGPYQITIREPGGDEITLNKLAIAYYRKAGGDA